MLSMLRHKSSSARVDPHFTLDLSESSRSWACIAKEGRCPDVEVCVRVGEQMARKTMKDSVEVDVDNVQPPKPRGFRIASLVKLFINLAFCIILIDRNPKPTIDFDTRVFEIYKSQERLFTNPTIFELLRHIEGFVEMNRSLLSPDGTFMFSDIAQFVRHAVRLSNARHDSFHYQYSSANHIFAAEILKILTGMEIDDLLQSYIFGPFGMRHTTLNEKKLRKLMEQDEIDLVPGFQLSGDIEELSTVQQGEFQYMSNSLEKAFLGGWSTAEDLDNLFAHLLKVYRGEENSQHISRNAVLKFFESPDGHSLAGVRIPLTSDKSAQGLSDIDINAASLYTLGQRAGKGTYAQTYYSGASMTGAATSLYLDPEGGVSVLVLANLAVPNMTHHIANDFLQEVFALLPHVDIAARLKNGQSSITARLNQFGQEDRDASAWASDNFEKFVGTYRGIENDQCITISDDKYLCFVRGDRKSKRLSVRSMGDAIRIVPVSFSFIIDRQSCRSDVELKLEQDREGFLLRSGEERYRKET